MLESASPMFKKLFSKPLPGQCYNTLPKLTRSEVFINLEFCNVQHVRAILTSNDTLAGRHKQ